MASLETTIVISKDAVAILEVPPEIDIPPGEYEVTLEFREPPHFASPAEWDDYETRDLHHDAELLPTIELSEGVATISQEGKLTFRMPSGTQSGEYQVLITILGKTYRPGNDRPHRLRRVQHERANNHRE